MSAFPCEGSAWVVLVLDRRKCLMKLYSYCIPVDDGAAPNPFWGTCTLTICKPKIRRVAQVGDWIVGVGSVNVGGDDYSGKLVVCLRRVSGFQGLCQLHR